MLAAAGYLVAVPDPISTAEWAPMWIGSAAVRGLGPAASMNTPRVTIGGIFSMPSLRPPS